MRCRSAEVLTVVGWSREASEPQYRDSIRCDAGEVVVPELVFERIGTWTDVEHRLPLPVSR